jgi:hypothetical protein
MKKLLILSLLTMTILCGHSALHLPQHTILPCEDSTKVKSSDEGLSWLEKELRSVPKGIKPVPGYRFVIVGDFNGDGRRDTLVEHFVSLLDGMEANKLYDSLDSYDQLVALTVSK